MFEFIIILACIGALYQWRHTDFVYAIRLVLRFVGTIALFAVGIAFLVYVSRESHPQLHKYEITTSDGVKLHVKGISLEDAWQRLKPIIPQR